MAKIDSLTFEIRLAPDKETMQVILLLLNLWQDAHPGQMVAMVPAKDRYQYEIIPVDKLMKEQEAVKPRVSSVEQRCGNCNKVIEMDGWKACPWCGKLIDWSVIMNGT